MGRPIFSPGKKLTGGKFRPVTPVTYLLSLLFSVRIAVSNATKLCDTQ